MMLTENRTPLQPGSSELDSPNLTGWGIAANQVFRSECMKSWEHLRKTSEPMDLDHFGVPEEARRAFKLAMGQWILDDAHGFWLEPESKDGHSNPEEFVVVIAERIYHLGSMYNCHTPGSPIEDQLGAALLWCYMDWAGFPHLDYATDPKDRVVHSAVTESLEYWITPQAEVAGYRVDFLMWFQLGRHMGGIAIECDGHQFHEKTKEQASRDKARDRAILLAGYPVIRFSGSDIFRDPYDCVLQVKNLLDPVLDRVSRDGGLYGA